MHLDGCLKNKVLKLLRVQAKWNTSGINSLPPRIKTGHHAKTTIVGLQHLHIHDQITNATKTVCNPASSANLLIGFSEICQMDQQHAMPAIQSKSKIKS